MLESSWLSTLMTETKKFRCLKIRLVVIPHALFEVPGWQPFGMKPIFGPVAWR